MTYIQGPGQQIPKYSVKCFWCSSQTFYQIQICMWIYDGPARLMLIYYLHLHIPICALYNPDMCTHTFSLSSPRTLHTLSAYNVVMVMDKKCVYKSAPKFLQIKQIPVIFLSFLEICVTARTKMIASREIKQI